ISGMTFYFHRKKSAVATKRCTFVSYASYFVSYRYTDRKKSIPIKIPFIQPLMNSCITRPFGRLNAGSSGVSAFVGRAKPGISRSPHILGHGLLADDRPFENVFENPQASRSLLCAGMLDSTLYFRSELNPQYEIIRPLETQFGIRFALNQPYYLDYSGTKIECLEPSVSPFHLHGEEQVIRNMNNFFSFTEVVCLGFGTRVHDHA
ncbi:hypothetical protein PMAYCL1PPCAC_01110, partial [Pristionchus mayeri]